ncbi:MAG: GTP pyrophosphokinase [Anaerolineae bacterium]|nr:GTP pyrophosphokinase [Anaerolineae bacterium]
MPSLEDAIALAVKVHQGQVDKYGQPYILHPLRVMFRLETGLAQMVGILHDVIEDSDLTFDDLRRMGYSDEVITALDGVTRREGETYDEFVERSLAHPVSRQVKLADLEDNMDLRRLSVEMTERDFERLKRYRRAWERLDKQAR